MKLVLMVAALALAGCGNEYAQEELDRAVEQFKEAGKNIDQAGDDFVRYVKEKAGSVAAETKQAGKELRNCFRKTGCSVEDGKDGETVVGPQGEPGRDGVDSKSTHTVETHSTVVKETIVEESPIIEIIDPCGDGPGFDEVILRLTDNQLISYFEDRGKRFLANLTPGKYRTTDKQQCKFTITSDLQILD